MLSIEPGRPKTSNIFQKELEAYLVATGLNDYVSTDKEEKALTNFPKKGCGITLILRICSVNQYELSV